MCQIWLTIGNAVLYGKVYTDQEECLKEVVKLNDLSKLNNFDIHYSLSFQIN